MIAFSVQEKLYDSSILAVHFGIVLLLDINEMYTFIVGLIFFVSRGASCQFVKKKKIELSAQNNDSPQVNYYLMSCSG